MSSGDSGALGDGKATDVTLQGIQSLRVTVEIMEVTDAPVVGQNKKWE
jgi:hypothetical protein